MKKVEITATARTIEGTKGAAALRRAKRVPCVLYGGAETIHFSVEESVLSKAVFSPEAHLFVINLDGKQYTAQLQDKQFHALTDRILHVDFLDLSGDKDARVSLNLRLTGQSAGVRAGGKLSQNLRKIRVKGKPEVVPSTLELDITQLGVAQSIRVRDLKFEGLTVTEKPNDVVVLVKAPKKVAEVAETAKGGKKK